jgi:hypothetical protein
MHNHSCSCDHDNVKYCRVCGVVHCLDCNQEWRSGWSWYGYRQYPSWNPYYIYTGGIQGTTSVQYVAQSANAQPSDNTVPTSGCTHGA